MKNIFLSLPMSGRTEEDIWAEIFDMTQYVIDNKEKFGLKDEELIFYDNMLSPQEIELLDIVDDVKHKNLLYLGTAITKLASCDLIFFSKNWSDSKGCKIEFEVSKEYDIPRYFA